MVSQLNAIAEILTKIQTYVSILLVFTMINRLSWFFSVLGVMFNVQGVISSIGMFLGTRLEDDEEKFKVYRYLNLIHVYLHTQTTTHLKESIDDRVLLECGLLT